MTSRHLPPACAEHSCVIGDPNKCADIRGKGAASGTSQRTVLRAYSPLLARYAQDTQYYPVSCTALSMTDSASQSIIQWQSSTSVCSPLSLSCVKTRWKCASPGLCSTTGKASVWRLCKRPPGRQADEAQPTATIANRSQSLATGGERVKQSLMRQAGRRPVLTDDVEVVGESAPPRVAEQVLEHVHHHARQTGCTTCSKTASGAIGVS